MYLQASHFCTIFLGDSVHFSPLISDADSDLILLRVIFWYWRWKYFVHISKAPTSFQGLSHSLGVVLVTPLQIISAVTVLVWKYDRLIHSLPGGWLHDCCTPTPAPATLPNPIPTQQRRSLGHFLTDIGEILENWKLIVWKQEQSWTSMDLRNASAAAACTYVQLWFNLTFKYWQKDISMDQWQRWWRRLKLWSTIKRVKSAILHSIYRVKRSPQPARLVWCRSADGAGGGGSKKSQMINNLSAVFIPSHTTKPSSAGCWFMPNDLFLDPVGSLVSTLWVVGGWVTLF